MTLEEIRRDSAAMRQETEHITRFLQNWSPRVLPDRSVGSQERMQALQTSVQKMEDRRGALTDTIADLVKEVVSLKAELSKTNTTVNALRADLSKTTTMVDEVRQVQIQLEERMKDVATCTQLREGVHKILAIEGDQGGISAHTSNVDPRLSEAIKDTQSSNSTGD